MIRVLSRLILLFCLLPTHAQNIADKWKNLRANNDLDPQVYFMISSDNLTNDLQVVRRLDENTAIVCGNEILKSSDASGLIPVNNDWKLNLRVQDSRDEAESSFYIKVTSKDVLTKYEGLKVLNVYENTYVINSTYGFIRQIPILFIGSE